MRFKNFIPILILLAIVSGLVWGIPFDSPVKDDAHDFDKAAVMIAENGIFYEHDFMNWMIERQFYPIFLAGVYKIFGHSPAAVRVIQILIFACLTLLVYKLCQQLFSERFARWAGVMTAFCYSIAGFTSWLYREVFFCTLVFLLIYCLYQAQLKKKTLWFVLSGLVFGMASLTNTVIQLFLAVIVINFLILNRREWKKIVPKVVVFLITFLIFVSPWVVSNYIDYGRTPFFSKSGVLLAQKAEKMHDIQGNYFQHLVANTTGDFFAQKLFSDYDRKEARYGEQADQEWGRMIESGMDRKEVDAILNKRAIKDIISHPIMALEMCFIDFLKYNTPMVPDVRMQHMFAEPDSHPELSDFTKGSIILFIRFIYLVFAIFILYAIIKHTKNWQKVSWIILIVFYFNFIFSNLIGVARHSVPMYPYYIILFVLGLTTFWRRRKI